MDDSAQHDQQRWAAIDALFDRLLDLPEAERAGLLDGECADDPALRAEVESLLAASAASDDFLNAPVLPTGSAAPLLSAGLGLEKVGCYRLVNRIGRGGMGEVFEAERDDGQFEQKVAIKLIRADIEVPFARFEAERQILARLDHPGIARLIDGGIAADGRPYMVVEFVAGQTLRGYCIGRELTLDTRLDLFRQIAEAVRYAHRHLVIHRDLKSANVLVDGDGRARLLDFGIATLLTAPGTATEQTRILATPENAAPEQLRGEPISTATDVYALGLLLHELLTGLPARDFTGLPLTVAIRQVLETSLPTPSSLSRVLPPEQLRGDLDAIVARALRPDVATRYPSVDALLDDLDRWQCREPVLARDGNRAYVIGRFLRRHRLAVIAATTVIAVLLAGVLGVLWQAREAARQRDAAQSEAARANAVRDYVLHLFRTARDDQPGDAPSAQAVLQRAAEKVRERFADDPAAARSMLLSLGELYYELRDSPGADAVLRAYLEVPAGDPVETALARARLADVRYDLADSSGARALLDQAVPVLDSVADRHSDRHADARLLDAALLSDHGDYEAAIRRIGALAASLEARQGPTAAKLGDVWNARGNAELASGDHAAAVVSFRKALSVLDAHDRADSQDALIIQGNLCDALLRNGEAAAAERCFATVLPRFRALYGESAALVPPLLMSGLAHLEQAAVGPALGELTQASALADRYFSADAGIGWLTRLTAMEARLASGQTGDAQAMLADAIASRPAIEDPVTSALAAVLRARIARSGGDAALAAAERQRAVELAGDRRDPYRWHLTRALRAFDAVRDLPGPESR